MSFLPSFIRDFKKCLLMITRSLKIYARLTFLLSFAGLETMQNHHDFPSAIDLLETAVQSCMRMLTNVSLWDMSAPCINRDCLLMKISMVCVNQVYLQKKILGTCINQDRLLLIFVVVFMNQDCLLEEISPVHQSRLLAVGNLWCMHHSRLVTVGNLLCMHQSRLSAVRNHCFVHHSRSIALMNFPRCKRITIFLVIFSCRLLWYYMCRCIHTCACVHRPGLETCFTCTVSWLIFLYLPAGTSGSRYPWCSSPAGYCSTYMFAGAQALCIEEQLEIRSCYHPAKC